MFPTFDQLSGILTAEINRGYKNNSYAGGLGEFADFWENRAIQEATNGEEHQRIHRVAKGLRYYHKVSLGDRPRYVRQMLGILQGQVVVEELLPELPSEIEELVRRKEHVLSEIANFDTQRRQLQANVNELDQRKEHLLSEITSLDTQRQQLQADMNKFRGDQNVLQSQNQQMQNRKVELESEITMLASHNTQLVEHRIQLENEIETAKAALAKLVNFVKELKSKANALEQEQRASTQLEKTNRLIKRKIEIENEISNLNHNLDEHEYEQLSLNQKIEQIEKQKAEMMAKPPFARESGWKSKEKHLTDEIGKLNEQKAQLQNEIANLNKDLESWKRQREDIDWEMNSKN